MLNLSHTHTVKRYANHLPSNLMSVIELAACRPAARVYCSIYTTGPLEQLHQAGLLTTHPAGHEHSHP